MKANTCLKGDPRENSTDVRSKNEQAGPRGSTERFEAGRGPTSWRWGTDSRTGVHRDCGRWGSSGTGTSSGEWRDRLVRCRGVTQGPTRRDRTNPRIWEHRLGGVRVLLRKGDCPLWGRFGLEPEGRTSEISRTTHWNQTHRGAHTRDLNYFAHYSTKDRHPDILQQDTTRDYSDWFCLTPAQSG